VVEWVLAVDFGTSNTAAAGHELGRSHRARAVKLSSASTEMPSGVLAHDGRLLTGESAYNQAGACPPGGYERTPKRRLGEGQLLLGDRLVEDVELVAVVLRAAVDKVARQFSGVAPGQVRLTHPAAWAGLRLERLLVAASQAGLAEPMLVAEPVAAATWYVVEHGGRQPPGPVAVVDVGGGTTDVAVLQPDGDAGFSLRAVGGIDPLGGEVFDQALHDLVGELVAERGRSDLWERLHDGGAIGQRRTLDDQVRAAKHTLSEESVAYIQVAVSDDVETVTVTREQFNARIRPLFEPAVTATRQALADANLESTDLAAWYLTGGSSHVHLVHELLTTALSTPPTNFVDDPKTVTCLGALHHTTPTRSTNKNPPPSSPLRPTEASAAARDGTVALEANRTLSVDSMTEGTTAALTAGIAVPGDSGQESGGLSEPPLQLRAPLRRPRDGRMLAGVAAGLAAYLGVGVAKVRIVIVVLSSILAGISYGVGGLLCLLAYLVATIVISKGEGDAPSSAASP
jgi:molecular chaperone DnaK (HSP70)/phage shock protein PspC (stress-responsive transcriptional regulator)